MMNSGSSHIAGRKGQPMEEIEMVRELGSTHSPVDTHEAKNRVRARIDREIEELSRPRYSWKPGRSARLLIAASLALLTIGGIAVAGGFDDDAPVVTVDSSVEEQIAGLVFQISEAVTELDVATSEAGAAAIRDRIAALDARVAELCAELPISDEGVAPEACATTP